MTDQQEYNRQLIEQFRAERGQEGGSTKGRPLLLLTTSGAMSGQPRTAPMMYIADDDHLVVIASNAGAQAHPAWYHNLVAHPGVTVEVGDEVYDATARVLEGAERQRVWDTLVASYPFFLDHQAKISRQIPLVALHRRVE